MEMEQLRFMKAHMARRGNWKEVERINKMIAFNLSHARTPMKRTTRTANVRRAIRRVKR